MARCGSPRAAAWPRPSGKLPICIRDRRCRPGARPQHLTILADMFGDARRPRVSPLRIAVPGYEIGAALPSGPRALVLHARRISDQLPVVLKLAAGTDPFGRRRDDLAHEYALLRSLDIPGVPRALELA